MTDVLSYAVVAVILTSLLMLATTFVAWRKEANPSRRKYMLYIMGLKPVVIVVLILLFVFWDMAVSSWKVLGLFLGPLALCYLLQVYWTRKAVRPRIEDATIGDTIS